MSSASLFAVSLFVTSLLIVRSAECWPFGEANNSFETETNQQPLVLLQKLKQRLIELKKQQAYNEHMASVLKSLVYKNKNNGDQPEGEVLDHRLLYRVSRSHGKPTFIRFGKRASPAFIRFGKRGNDEIKTLQPHSTPK